MKTIEPNSLNPRPSNMVPSNGFRAVSPNTIMFVEPIGPSTAPMMMLEPANATYEMSPNASAMPSVTMTISSPDPSSIPAIELNTNMMSPMASNATPVSAALIQRPQFEFKRPRTHTSFRYVEPLVEQLDCDSRIRANAPLVPRRPASPAKVFRSERFQQKTLARQPLRLEYPSSSPVQVPRQTLVTINHNWRQSPGKLASPVQPIQQQEQLELEDLVAVGPPQLIPVYQTPNGRLHVTPPPTMRPSLATSDYLAGGFESEGSSAVPADDPSGEVHLMNPELAARLKANPESNSMPTSTSSPEQQNASSSKPAFASGQSQAKVKSFASTGGY